MPTQRATNLELQKWIARQHGFIVESAWIEQSRQLLIQKSSSASTPGQESVPPEKLIAIKQAFRHFGMLR